MTKEDLAELLSGRHRNEEITSWEEKVAHDNGLVVMFGASDDLVICKGVIDDEISAYDGCHFKFSKHLEIKTGDKHEGHRRSVEAMWGYNDCPWSFKTEIPHSTFNILNDDELFCVGIIINVAELP